MDETEPPAETLRSQRQSAFALENPTGGGARGCVPPRLAATVAAMMRDSLGWIIGYLLIGVPPSLTAAWSSPMWFALVAGIAQVAQGQIGIVAGHRPIPAVRRFAMAVIVASGSCLLVGKVLTIDWSAVATMSVVAGAVAICGWSRGALLARRRRRWVPQDAAPKLLSTRSRDDRGRTE